MQPELARKLVAMFVDPILDEVFPGETGAARLQQIGLFTLIFVEDGGTGVTAQRLADRTGQSPSAVYKQLDKLERVNVVTKTKRLNKQGRGQAFHFSIASNEKTQRLTAAIIKTISSSARTRRKKR